MSYKSLAEFFGDIESLVHTAGIGRDAYVQPALKNLGSVAIPIIREVVAPAAFRNADPEVTDIDVHGTRRVRAVSNKFKYGERSRGLQVLRYFNAGGNMPQNRTAFTGKEKVSSGYDMNTVVFGDSANYDKRVLPVKASFQYSDAISIAPYGACVDATFHNRASEDGTLFNAEKKENSVNLFERHFIVPGSLLLQVITINGRTAPIEALDHFLLSLGLAGAYGGQTSVYGINVKNHVVGIYGGRFERPVASPYEAIRDMGELTGDDARDLPSLLSKVDGLFSGNYPVRVAGKEVAEQQKSLISALERNDDEFATSYRDSGKKIGEFFDAWFLGEGK